MFTSIDKALVALVMGGLYLLNSLFGIDIGVSQDTVSVIVAGLTPILVWLVPNKAPSGQSDNTLHSPWFIPLIALFLLAGCADGSGWNPFRPDDKLSAQTRYYQIKSAYAVAKEEAADYAALPFCNDTIIVGCAHPEIVVRLDEAADRADEAFKVAEPYLIILDPNAIVTAAQQEDTLLAATLALRQLTAILATAVAQNVRNG